MGNELDPLDRDTSIAGELKEAGLEGKTNSRAVAALDRLVGNLFDFLNPALEDRAARQRAKTAAAVSLAEAKARFAIRRLEFEERFARRSLRNKIIADLREQANKDGVAQETIEILRLNPPDASKSNEGPDSLSLEFMSNFDSYAARASTADLRKKWAHILSQEIREPGTFSTKVLRVVDELDAETAKLFEKLCLSRLAKFVPRCLASNISFEQIADLVLADLIVDPGFAGHVAQFGSAQGAPFWIVKFNRRGIAIAHGTAIPPAPADTSAPLTNEQNAPALPVFILTKAGMAIASIFEDNEVQATDALFDQICKVIPRPAVAKYHHLSGDQWGPIG